MRYTTYRIIKDFEEKQIYINLRLKQLNKEPEEIKNITKRVYGIVQNYDYLNFLVNELTEKRKLDLNTRRILILALYEHLYLDSVPEYAVISEYTNLCHKVNAKAVKYVSFFLNNQLKKASLIEPKYANEIKNISIKYSHPQWLVKRLEKDYPEDYLKILQANQEIKTITARKINELLHPENFVKTAYSDLVAANTNIIQTEDFKQGNIVIQDLGSYLIGKLVNAGEDDVVLDLCAAPGNKTRHIAATAKYIVANEINESRFKLLQNNLSQDGIKNSTAINCDATDYQAILETLQNKKLPIKYSKILVDAPCSGWGVFGSKPEARYYQNQKEINNIIQVQQQILAVANQLLAPNGELIYSTCTLNKHENEQQVLKFMNEYGYEEVNYEEMSKYQKAEQIGITLLPFEQKSDGFYMCKMKRK